MDMQSRNLDESTDVVAQVPSLDGHGRTMRLVCTSEPRLARTLWLTNSQPSFRVGSTGIRPTTPALKNQGCPPAAVDEPTRGDRMHCSLGPGFSLRSAAMGQSKSWLSVTQSKNAVLVDVSGMGTHQLSRPVFEY